MYESLRDRLGTPPPERSLVTFPDGSRDVYCTLSADERLSTREALADRVSGRRRSALSIERERVAPGGQAVNVARQAHALGCAVTLVGSLDDPLFDDLPVETHSTGPPATVYVCEFDDGVLMLADEGVRETWTLTDLRTAAPAPLDADVAVCTNWSSFPSMTAALETLAAEGVPADTFVVDPGDVSDRPAGDRRALLEALSSLADRTDVVLSANRPELRSLAEALGATAPDSTDCKPDRRLVERVAGTGIPTVLHERERALAVVDGEHRTVPNVEVETAAVHAGGGDRFTAGLAHGLATEMGLETALALGNACAARYIATGGTGGREELATFLDAHS